MPRPRGPVGALGDGQRRGLDGATQPDHGGGAAGRAGDADERGAQRHRRLGTGEKEGRLRRRAAAAAAAAAAVSKAVRRQRGGCAQRKMMYRYCAGNVPMLCQCCANAPTRTCTTRTTPKEHTPAAAMSGQLCARLPLRASPLSIVLDSDSGRGVRRWKPVWFMQNEVRERSSKGDVEVVYGGCVGERHLL